VGIRDLAKRLTTSVDELENDRLHHRFGSLDVTPVGHMGSRAHVRVGGEVKRIRTAPRSGVPTLEITVCDGTGDAVAVFTGRRRIAGIETGRAIVLEGVPHPDGERKIMLNPAYTLLPR
jgi:hypothetical protein